MSTLDGSWPGLDRSKLVRMVRKLSAAGPKGFVEGKSCPFEASVFDRSGTMPSNDTLGRYRSTSSGPFRLRSRASRTKASPVPVISPTRRPNIVFNFFFGLTGS